MREGAPLIVRPCLSLTQKFNNNTITDERFTAIAENYVSKVVGLPQLSLHRQI